MHTASKDPPFPSEMAPPRSPKHSNFIHMRTKPRRSHHLTNGFPTFNILLVPTHQSLRKWLLHFPILDLSSIWSSHQSTRDSTIMLVVPPLLTLIAPCTRRGWGFNRLIVHMTWLYHCNHIPFLPFSDNHTPFIPLSDILTCTSCSYNLTKQFH